MQQILIIDDRKEEIDILYDYFKKKGITGLLKKEDGYLTHTPGDMDNILSEKDQRDRLVGLLKSQWNKAKIFLIDMALRGGQIETPPVSQQGLEYFLFEGKEYTKQTKQLTELQNGNKHIVFITRLQQYQSKLQLKKEHLTGHLRLVHKPLWLIGRNTKGEKYRPGKSKEICLNSDVCDNYKKLTDESVCYKNDCLRNVIIGLLGENSK